MPYTGRTMIRRYGLVGVLAVALLGAGCTINVNAEPTAPSSTTVETASVERADPFIDQNWIEAAAVNGSRFTLSVRKEMRKWVCSDSRLQSGSECPTSQNVLLQMTSDETIDFGLSMCATMSEKRGQGIPGDSERFDEIVDDLERSYALEYPSHAQMRGMAYVGLRQSAEFLCDENSSWATHATTTRLTTTTTLGASSGDSAYLGLLERLGGFDMSSTNRETLVAMGWAVCEAVDRAVHEGEDAATFMGYMTEPMSRVQGFQFVKAVTAATLYLCPWNEYWE